MPVSSLIISSRGPKFGSAIPCWPSGYLRARPCPACGVAQLVGSEMAGSSYGRPTFPTNINHRPGPAISTRWVLRKMTWKTWWCCGLTPTEQRDVFDQNRQVDEEPRAGCGPLAKPRSDGRPHPIAHGDDHVEIVVIELPPDRSIPLPANCQVSLDGCLRGGIPSPAGNPAASRAVHGPGYLRPPPNIHSPRG